MSRETLDIKTPLWGLNFQVRVTGLRIISTRLQSLGNFHPEMMLICNFVRVLLQYLI